MKILKRPSHVVYSDFIRHKVFAMSALLLVFFCFLRFSGQTFIFVHVFFIILIKRNIRGANGVLEHSLYVCGFFTVA